MEETIKVVNELQENGLIKNYAIGGEIAIIYYVESILTYDLDIFFEPPEEEREMIILSSIYDWLRKKGYKPHKEHIFFIEGIPVQFIPVYNELTKEALETAVEAKYGKMKTRVFKSEYLLAIMLQTFRPSDRERMIKFLNEVEMNKNYPSKILEKYSPKEKFEKFLRLYYEE